MIRTYSQPIKATDLIFETSKESSQIYNQAIELHKRGVNFKDIGKTIDAEFDNKFLLAQSRQASYQQYSKDFKSYLEALKSYKSCPDKFSGQPKPPHKIKFIRSIYFKEEAIKYIDGNLFLSLKKPNDPIIVRWTKDLPIPQFASITFDKYKGWELHLIVEIEQSNEVVEKNDKVMSIDLGVKRVATTFDGTNTITYSGKELMSLNNLRNKLTAKTQAKYANAKKDSRRRKYLKRCLRKNIFKIKNKEKDILHKYSRMIVEDAISNNIGTIVIGDCSNTHNKTNCGKNNQRIQQNPEQKLAKYIDYKFQSTGRLVKVISERRTSKTCPECDHVHKNSPKGRIFTCKSCGFTYDRDGVGSVNIYRLEVSLSHDEWLNVVGRLTRPLGIKYIPNLSIKCKTRSFI